MTDGGPAVPLRSVATRAEQLIALRRPDEALGVLGPAIVQHPDAADLLCLAAHAHLLREEPESALDLASRAAAYAPESEWPHRLRSIALAELGRHSDAAASAFRSVQLSPFLYVAHVQYARALSRLPGPLAHAQAWEEGQRAVQLAPNEPEVHLLMAHLAHPTTGTSQEGLRIAEAALRRTLELDPGNSAALNDLARIQLRRRRGVRAIAGFSDALTADPRNSAALHNVAVVLTTWLRPAHWLLLVAIYLSLVVLGEAWSGVAHVVIAVVVVATLAVVLLRLHRAVPGRVGVFVRQLPRFSRWATAWALCLLLSAALLVVAAAVPTTAAAVATVVAFLAIHVGLVCNWVWAARARRR